MYADASEASSSSGSVTEGGADIVATPGGDKRKEPPEAEVTMDTLEETRTRVEKRKANEELVGDAVKSMKLDEMIAYVNEGSADMGSLL